MFVFIRLGVVKIRILPQMIHRFNVTPTKTPVGFYRLTLKM